MGSQQQALLAQKVKSGGDITTALQAWYKFDEGTGTATTADSSGNGFTGTLQNSPSWIAGQVGPYALSFNGSNQYVTVGATAVLRPAAFTLAAWILDAGARPTPNARMIFALNQNDVLLRCADSSDAHLEFLVLNGSYRTTASVVFTANTWTHVAVTFDGANVIVYVNGTAVTTGTGSLSYESGASNSLGALQSGGQYWNGDLDDMRIYSRVLTALDVATLYAYR